MSGERQSICNYGNHVVADTDILIYSDEDRGLRDVRTCRTCYAAHIIKYYPCSKIVDEILGGRMLINDGEKYKEEKG